LLLSRRFYTNKVDFIIPFAYILISDIRDVRNLNVEYFCLICSFSSSIGQEFFYFF
jgi:hypothetical protein